MTNYNRIRVVVMGSSRVGKSAVTVRYLTKRFIGEYSSSRDFLYKHTVVFDGGARTDVEILDTSKCSGVDLHPKFDGGGAWRRGRPVKVVSGSRGGNNGARANQAARRRIARGGSEEEEDEDDFEEYDEEDEGRGGVWGGGEEDYGGDYEPQEADEEEEEEHLRWGDAFVVVYSVCDRRSFRSAKRLLARLSRLHGGGRHGVSEDDGHLVATPLAAPALLLGNKRDLDHAREIGVDAGQELSLRYGAQFYEVSAAQSYAGVSLAFHSLLREARSQRLLRTLSSSSSSASSPTSSSCSISSSPPPPPTLFLDHFACHPPPPPPPTPTPLHRLLRSLSSSSSSSSASTASASTLAAGQRHTLPHHRCDPFFVTSASCPSTPISMHPSTLSKTLPAHKRARLGMGNSVSKVLGTIFGKNGGGGDSSGSSTSGGTDRKTKKKRPSLSI
ncbi:uncharacterized protein LOC124161433 [Ischnura elegans]|uniref:uncharacterized protein LOC124161433 n=1 Tax=Ischnura elegans TaxID=197161 RepID=UPI001ED8B602|nr:uncharacterized protein LOC124161433 [Ischnura elegans]